MKKVKEGMTKELILNIAGEGILVGDPKGNITFVNPPAARMLGWEVEELIGQTWRTLHAIGQHLKADGTPNTLEECPICGAFNDGIVHYVDNEVFGRRDGTSFPVEYTSTPILEFGELTETVLVFRDITERKRAEEALRQSEAYLSEAQRLSHTGSFGWRVSTSEIVWSEETFRIFQYDRTTKPTVELVFQRTHPEDAAFVKQTIERASQDGKDFDFEHRLLMPDGSIKHVRVVGHAERDKSSELEFVGAVMDVTAAKEAEERIRQDERELRITIETIPAFVLSTLPDGSVDFASQSWLNYVGCSTEEMLDWGWMKITHLEDLDRVVNNWQAALASGEPLEIEVRIRRADEKYRWFLARAVPLRDGKGNVVKWYTTVTDIEDRKQAEEKLRASEAYLAEAQTLSRTGSSAWNPASKQIVHWSEETYRIFGFDPKEGLPSFQTVFQRADPEDRERAMEIIAAAARERKAFELDCRIVLPDGAMKYLHAVGHPVFNASGDVVEFVSTMMDVTERRRAEEELRETLDHLSKKNRYESIISAVTQSVHRSINFQEVLENAVETMSKNIDSVDSVSIFLVEGQEAILKVNRGFPDWFIERMRRIPYPKGATWKTIIEEKPIYCADVDQDTVIGPSGRELGIKSYLITPIRYEGKTIGTLNINSLQKNAFDEEELKLLEVVAQQSEIAINKAQQAEALRKALLEVEQLRDRLQAENVYLQEEIRIEHNFEEIVGESEPLKNVLRNVERVAPTDTTVLIQGETGTGKELVARAIHNLSQRKDRPLVKVNCPALPAGLIESELFGHEKGAFTGALSHKIGRFELGNGGTIFLDEIGDLPLELQAKLLRVLQEGEFERVGGSRTIEVDVRVIAATNRDLKKAMEEGKFRPDLYYRLNVFPILIPPLRERKEDIPVLVRYFAMKYGTKLGKKVETISQEMMDALLAYPWPGNARELENMIERAVILAHSPVIQIDESLETRLDTELQTSGSGTLEDVERAYILRVLDETNWVIHGKRGAALVLGLNPDTLRSRMKRLGIKRPGRST